MASLKAGLEGERGTSRRDVAQSDGIALSSSGKLDYPLGYHCVRRIIAIDQAQLAQRVFERGCEHCNCVRLKRYMFAFQSGPNRHFKIRAANTRTSR
jgi:hypothetical protein